MWSSLSRHALMMCGFNPLTLQTSSKVSFQTSHSTGVNALLFPLFSCRSWRVEERLSFMFLLTEFKKISAILDSSFSQVGNSIMSAQCQGASFPMCVCMCVPRSSFPVLVRATHGQLPCLSRFQGEGPEIFSYCGLSTLLPSCQGRSPLSCFIEMSQQVLFGAH